MKYAPIMTDTVSHMTPQKECITRGQSMSSSAAKIKVYTCAILTQLEIRPYWSFTGLSANLFKGSSQGLGERTKLMRQLLTEDIKTTKNKIDSPYEPPDLCEKHQELLLLQTGILTIKEGDDVVTLGMPNGEIRKSISGYLLEELAVQIDEEAILKASVNALESGNHGEFIESIKKFFERLYSNINVEKFPKIREHTLQDFYELYMGDLIEKTGKMGKYYICPKGDVGTRRKKGDVGPKKKRMDHYFIRKLPDSTFELVIEEFKRPESESTVTDAINQIVEDNEGVKAALANIKKNIKEIRKYIPDFDVEKITRLSAIGVKFVNDIKKVWESEVRTYGITLKPDIKLTLLQGHNGTLRFISH
eukprot:TRINITY_DN866_c0_g1_i7.p2 TRINITY_DN866_c0_g1~~TRINITY_DN866_c0_g1_i7.p2  ORF type:complete len:362 (+),score=37.49 TRINITY_DN866_c0_g1_i7:1875-2960(+)